MCRIARRRPEQLPRLHGWSGRVMSRRESSDASFRMFATTRSVRFLESEYAVPRAALPEVLTRSASWRGGSPSVRRSRSRSASRRPTTSGCPRASSGENAYVAIHQYVGMAHEEYFAEFARICAEVAGRPHWGKMHPLGFAEVALLYPRFERAAALRTELDPSGVLLNEHLRTLFVAP